MSNCFVSVKRKFQDLAKDVRQRLGLCGLKSDDIIIASFPKSGNTWMLFILANIISLCEMDGRQIDFNVLHELFLAEYDSI
jgi:hypothetical protein